MKHDFPYKKFESTKLWRILDSGITDLVENKDLEEKTAHKYIVGYLCDVLSKSKVSIENND